MRKTVLTLGTFDGVHLGHQALFKKVIQQAKASRATPVALAFDMPPRHAGEPGTQPILLTTLAEKRMLLRTFGIKSLGVLVFNRKTASTPPERFFRETIVRKWRARVMVVGPKVAFGKNRTGRLSLLKALGKTYGVRVDVVHDVRTKTGAVSSRRIRTLLAEGKIERANHLLGYPYSVEGRVVHGDHRGRTISFPTANLQIDPRKIVPPGVYWVKAHPATKFPVRLSEVLSGWDGLCNVGTRPTFAPQSHHDHCEVYLWGKPGSLYGKQIRLVFLRRLRAERRFPSRQALQRQIRRDLVKAKLYRKAHFSI